MSEKDIDLKQGTGQDIVDITELINPFPGLRPFGVEESHLFFGREGQNDEALVKLADNRFVAILGASGSGKSSFVYCGLIPTLHGGFMTDAGSNWRIVTCRPGGGPIDNLAEALLIKDQEYQMLSEEDQLIRKTIIGTVLRSSSLGLVEVIKQLKTDDFQNVLVLVDQFEELFRFSKLEAQSSDQNESAAFVNLLLEASQYLDEPIYVALTMRSDFIGECAKYPDLTQLINDSHYLIPQMTRDQKRMIIEGPVAVGGGKIAPRLTQQLLNDLGDNPDQLPILQHALMRTWSKWVEIRKEGEPMDLNHYNAIGTLREALSQHANEAYDLLSKREKEICEIMFKALTEKGAENQGIRRPTKLSTIASIAGVTEEEVEKVIDRFREPGRSLLMPPYGVKLQSDSVIDISHESLMRIWDRLKQWLDEESKSAEMYIKLSDAATKFQEGKASLWKMPDLQLAINWRADNKPTFVWGSRYNQAFERTMVFLDTSIKAFETEEANKVLLQKRKVRFVRTFSIIAGALAMVMLFLSVYAQLKANEAAENAIIAQENAAEAEIQRQAAVEQAALAREAQAEAEAQKVIADEQRDEAILQTQIAQAERARAEQQQKLAEQNAAEARRQQGIAQENEAEANLQRDLANIARDQADSARLAAERLRFQSIAQSMAIKAKDVPDPQLKALVAKQGYDFYQEYKDETKEYNGDIYSGAYYGLQGLIRAKTMAENPTFGQEIAYPIGDSLLNQYHGHKPLLEADKQVAVRSVSYSQDGQRMYSAGGDGRLIAWNVANRSYTEIYQSDRVNRVVNISPNERWLALATDANEIDLFDLRNTAADPRRIRSHRGAIYDLVFLPDNSGFISVGADQRILRTTLANNDVQEVAIVTSKVQTIAVSPDGNTLAVGSIGGDVVLYDLNVAAEDQSEKRVFRRNEDQLAVTDLSFSNTGKYLAIGGYNVATGFGYITLWDLELKEQFGPQLIGYTARVNDIEFSEGDLLVAGASHDGSVRMWDMGPDNIFDLPTVFDDHTDWVWDLDFNPDGDGLMTASADGLIRYFSTKPDEMVSQMCGYLERNMSDIEWRQFVADVNDIAWVETCEGKPKPVPEEE